MTASFAVEPAGTIVGVEGEGIFAVPVTLAPQATDEGEKIVRVEVLPGARIAGRMLGPDAKPATGPLRLRVEVGEQGGREAIGAELECPVDPEGRFSCAIPAERLVDLKLRVRGYASIRYWGSRARPQETIQLGDLRLVPGGSVVGSVLSELPGRVDGKLEVRLVPLASTRGAVAASDPRAARLGEVVTPDTRGYFSFEGLSAGVYTVIAAQPGAVDAEIAGVRVHPGAESEIREPLRLRAPISLTVFIDPPYFRLVEDWRVALWRSQGSGFAPLSRANSMTEAGVFVARDLAPGTYRVDVSPPVGGLFASELVEVEPPSTTLTLPIDAVDVEGTIRLGESPLWCRVTFVRSGRTAEISVDSNEDGEYSIVLPSEGEWSVRVQSVDPDVERLVEDVKVVRLEGAGKAIVDIDLPGTRLAGRTVDESGAAIEGASVLLTATPFVRQPEQTKSGEAGRFELEGVEPGSYRLSAESHASNGDVASGSRTVEISNERELPEVEIVLRKKLRVRGRVLGPDGLGVPAAFVGATASGYDFGEMSAHDESETDVRGEFVLDLPAGTRTAEIEVQAAGHALRLIHTVLEPGRELQLIVSPLGGGLEIEFAHDPAWLNWGARRPYLVSSTGAKLFVGVLVKWAELNGVRNAAPAARLMVPLLEPGDYRICWLGPPGASGPEGCTAGRVEALSWTRVRTP